MTKILVLGYTNSGKSTASKILADILKVRAISTSEYLIRDFAVSSNIDPERIRANKGQYRKALLEFGKIQQIVDPAYPVRAILRDGFSITDGVRTKQSLENVRPLFDKIIWIDRESVSRGKTDEIDSSDADEVISNNGTIEDLRIKLTMLCK